MGGGSRAITSWSDRPSGYVLQTEFEQCRAICAAWSEDFRVVVKLDIGKSTSRTERVVVFGFDT